MKTAIELQMWLVKQLPHLLRHSDLSPLGPRTEWRESHETVTPREWLWIVAKVEKTLDEEQRDTYLNTLYDVVTSYSMLNDSWKLNTATWQQRTTALMKMKGNKI